MALADIDLTDRDRFAAGFPHEGCVGEREEGVQANGGGLLLSSGARFG